MRRVSWRIGIGLALVPALALAAGAAEREWLAICAKCIAPSVITKSGIGTADARAEARVQKQDAVEWCGNWQPDDRNCVRDQMASDEARQTYRARANCPAGTITAIDGNTYSLAGVWTSDLGRGRTRWRDAAGHIVGQDNASGGLGIAQQWEVLCPGFRGAGRAGTGPGNGLGNGNGAPPPGRSAPSPLSAAPAPGARYVVGQAIEGKYLSAWIPGRINAIGMVNTPSGPAPAYDVTLANGKRGIVPGRLIRPAAP